MLIYDTLDKLAENCIPKGVHDVLHVNSRVAWVETVYDMYEKGMVDLKYTTVKRLLENWEQLLYKKYSQLN